MSRNSSVKCVIALIRSGGKKMVNIIMVISTYGISTTQLPPMQDSVQGILLLFTHGFLHLLLLLLAG